MKKFLLWSSVGFGLFFSVGVQAASFQDIWKEIKGQAFDYCLMEEGQDLHREEIFAWLDSNQGDICCDPRLDAVTNIRPYLTVNDECFYNPSDAENMICLNIGDGVCDRTRGETVCNSTDCHNKNLSDYNTLEAYCASDYFKKNCQGDKLTKYGFCKICEDLVSEPECVENQPARSQCPEKDMVTTCENGNICEIYFSPVCEKGECAYSANKQCTPCGGQCSNGKCIIDEPQMTGYFCDNSDNCYSGNCDNICYGKGYGEACSRKEECGSGICEAGVCRGGDPGVDCSQKGAGGQICISGRCDYEKGACKPIEVESYCYMDGHIYEEFICDFSLTSSARSGKWRKLAADEKNSCISHGKRATSSNDRCCAPEDKLKKDYYEYTNNYVCCNTTQCVGDGVCFENGEQMGDVICDRGEWKANECVALGGRGPNGSLGPSDPNKDKRCCKENGIQLVPRTPLSDTNILADGHCDNLLGGRTVCIACGDGRCDPNYENFCNCPLDCKDPGLECGNLGNLGAKGACCIEFGMETGLDFKSWDEEKGKCSVCVSKFSIACPLEQVKEVGKEANGCPIYECIENFVPDDKVVNDQEIARSLDLQDFRFDKTKKEFSVGLCNISESVTLSTNALRLNGKIMNESFFDENAPNNRPTYNFNWVIDDNKDLFPKKCLDDRYRLKIPAEKIKFTSGTAILELFQNKQYKIGTIKKDYIPGVTPEYFSAPACVLDIAGEYSCRQVEISEDCQSAINPKACEEKALKAKGYKPCDPNNPLSCKDLELECGSLGNLGEKGACCIELGMETGLDFKSWDEEKGKCSLCVSKFSIACPLEQVKEVGKEANGCPIYECIENFVPDQEVENLSNSSDTLDLSSQMEVTPGSGAGVDLGTSTETVLNSVSAPISVSIPPKTKITSDPNWDGKIHIKKLDPKADNIPFDYNSAKTDVFSVGSMENEIRYSDYVRIIIKDKAYKRMKFKNVKTGKEEEIPQCGGTYETPVKAGEACFIFTITSRKIETSVYTKHNTTWMGLEENYRPEQEKMFWSEYFHLYKKMVQ